MENIEKGGYEFQTQFHWHILDKGINHVYIKPRTPRLNDKGKRSRRIDEEEFYNYNRPHAALDGKTPYEG